MTAAHASRRTLANLSQPADRRGQFMANGHVGLRRRIEALAARHDLVLNWHNTVGKPVAVKPLSRSAATLIGRGFVHELSRNADIEFEKHGVIAMLRAPITRALGKRVMIVEDELLVAMMIEDILLEEDCDVLGPYTNLADALKAAASEAMDLAVLDVNLRGEKIYPVARMLSDPELARLRQAVHSG
eukprot:gene4336-4385_t